MDNEMIDRCVLAMLKAMQELPPNDANARSVVIATIKAMREPTEKMRNLVTDDIVITDKCYYCGGHIQGWQAMIDAVIND